MDICTINCELIFHFLYWILEETCFCVASRNQEKYLVYSIYLYICMTKDYVVGMISMLSLSLFVVKNLNMFKPNPMFHSINTRHCSDLHQPPVKLTKVQKGVYYSGIKVFNCLPNNIKSLSNDVRKFKLALKAFLLDGSFYTIQEFSDWSSIY